MRMRDRISTVCPPTNFDRPVARRSPSRISSHTRCAGLIIIRTVLCGLLLPAMASAQSFDKKIQDNQKRVQKIKNEIKAYEDKLVSSARTEKTEIERLNETNQKVGLLQQLLGELEQARVLAQGNISELRARLNRTREELSDLKKLTVQRLIQIYKHRDEDPLALVITSGSWTQAYARIKYLGLIAEQDRRDLQSLRKKKEAIEWQKSRIESELTRLQNVIADRKREKASLDREIKTRQATLGKIRKNKVLYQSLIEQRKDDLDLLQNLIAELERKKKEEERLALARRSEKASKSGGRVKEPIYFEKSDFAQYKGRLPYPVRGRITQKFGDHVHPVLGTKTRNPGVEIGTSENAPVYSVAKGKVTLISWLRRLGNTVIIDHGGGYYTVYAHLSEIYVAVDEPVQSGSLVGRVDESDDGKYSLHFEIYKNREAQDPSLWLK